ncbi:MAG: FHA domain-containing protein [Gemmatimonadales bacterium]
MPTPWLVPQPPTPGDPVELDSRVMMTIGGGTDAVIRVAGAGIAERHARLEAHDGGWWLSADGAPVKINGTAVTASVRLHDRDQIQVGIATFEFVSGEKRTRRMASAADMVAPPRKRRHGRIAPKGPGFSPAAAGTIVIAALLIGAAAVVAWYGFFHAGKSIVLLNDRQAAELDSLLAVAYDHVERGGTLLELGLGDGAANEFARAVNTLALSDLRNNPQVKPRIEALQASVASIYREESLAVPGNYAHATSPLTPDQLKTASLTVDQFAAQFALLSAAFRDHFGTSIVVTGRDHAEHVALYGKGGALDLSIKGLSPAEIAFITNQAHNRHIRIKDFSQDSVLRDEVQAAIRAGKSFEAGTGLHIHIDRFANRRDNWTSLRQLDSAERPLQLAESRPQRGVVVEGGVERR